MKSAILFLGVASALAIVSAASAQPEGPRAVRSEADDAAYQQQQRDYEAQKQQYDRRKMDYQAARDVYHLQREDYERARSDYDRRNGPGAYERRNGDYDRWHSRYDNDFYRPYADSPCEQRAANSEVAGGVIGALAGAALGSNIAQHGERSGGAILGAVAGGVVGANIGKMAAKCDDTGYYFRFNQTVAYDEGDWSGPSGRQDYRYYMRRSCRLAVAPTYMDGATDYRYVRVCPDEEGLYRITG